MKISQNVSDFASQILMKIFIFVSLHPFQVHCAGIFCSCQSMPWNSNLIQAHNWKLFLEMSFIFLFNPQIPKRTSPNVLVQFLFQHFACLLPSLNLIRDLTVNFSNYPPQWLRKKWSEVKRKVPDYHLLEFEGTSKSRVRQYLFICSTSLLLVFAKICNKEFFGEHYGLLRDARCITSEKSLFAI